MDSDSAITQCKMSQILLAFNFSPKLLNFQLSDVGALKDAYL